MNNVELNDLYDYEPLKIYQSKDYFKFSLDSILLAEFVRNPHKKENIIDLCAGNCAVSLVLSTKTNANITAVEIQEEIVSLGNKSIQYNNLGNKIKLVKSNVLDVKNYFPGNNVDAVVCNPPYFPSSNDELINNNKVKAVARHEILIDLENIIKVASSILQIDGEFYMVHRAERIDEIFKYCNKYNLNIKYLQFVTTKLNENAKLVLVLAIKNSNYGVKVLPSLNIENLKSFKNIFWR